MPEPLPLIWRWGLEYDDDDETINLKRIIGSLVNGSINPFIAAQQFDELTTRTALTRLAAVLKRSQPHQLTLEEENNGLNGRIFAPNPLGDMWCLIIGIACAAEACPPERSHILIELLAELSKLPAKHLPQTSSTDLSGQDNLIELYKDYLENRFHQWDLQEYGQRFLSYDWSGVEKPDSEERERWRNYQAFLANITVAGISDQSEYSALKKILPANQPKKGLPWNRPTDGWPKNQLWEGLGAVGRHSGEIFAAAEWLQRDIGKWVFEACKAATATVSKATETDSELSNTPATESKSLWNLENWRTWKVEFERVAEEEEYDAVSREAARSAVQAMNEFPI
ncbi:hypothetical protein C8J56DRAFT_1080114 [Mycena floridula]|nr:hypothetical protein C8J56DRAFT_1080114 [Mycena floridula]